MLNDAKLILRKSTAVPGTIDEYHDSVSVISTESSEEMSHRAFSDAMACFYNLRQFREGALRCHRYTYGDQWGDRINIDGQLITENEYLRQQGKMPLKNNMIRQLVKSVLGQFNDTPTRPVCVARNREDQVYGEMMTLALECAYDLNKIDSLDSKTLESYMITGLAVHKAQFSWLPEEQTHDVFVRNVSPYKVFFDNRIEDHAYRDITLIGELLDLSMSDIIRMFAGSDAKKAQRLRRLYTDPHGSMASMVTDTLKGERNRNTDFFMPEDPNLCRVIEVWRRESREFLHCHDLARGRTYRLNLDEYENVLAINTQRINEGAAMGIPPEDVAIIETSVAIDNYWYVRYFTPYGEVIAEFENPYAHGSHPYTLSVYPYINSEAHSFVEDVIDQQRYINRLITMIDFIMGSSAKGVLMMPEDAIPDGMTIEDVQAEWVRYNGVILFKARPGQPMPTQISTNATNVGAYELLNLQLKLIQDISGVQNAMQGKTPRSGTSGVQYQQESINAQNNLVNLLTTFRAFREARDMKIVKLMQQYYVDDFPMNSHSNFSRESHIYRCDAVRDVSYSLTISESASSPSYRLANNELLMQLFQMQAIDIKDLLRNGAFPNADKLLQSIEAREQEAQEAMAAQQQMQASMMPQQPQQLPIMPQQ